MDEPCSALDPISTLAIEDLIHQLKDRYTIIIVTHNMQQAARVSDRTAFFTIAGAGKPGRLIEIGDTAEMFTRPTEKAHRGLHHRPLRLTRRRRPAADPATDPHNPRCSDLGECPRSPKFMITGILGGGGCYSTMAWTNS